MFIDSHTHLEMREFDSDRSNVVSRATSVGVGCMVTVGTTLDDCRKAVELAHRYPSVYAAIGIHPHEAMHIDDETYGQLKVLAADDRVVAWGEIGLDFFRNHSPRDVQIQRFEEQLRIAETLDLPFIIHDREAHGQTLSMLKGWKGTRGGVIHCFSGDVPMARTCLDMGFYISIAGPVTYPKSDRLQDVVRHVPLDRLLIETDAPYLSPQFNRGKRNEPAFVVHTARQIASLKAVPLEEVGRVTSENAKALFGIP
ncbi:MAG: D-aminoacyl-tRNA deacylase [Syntrophus sp. SKADARSKE-3]|nr:D-aminoacyl-tRNA deacylase [Syntrophus sp. SKADARSKE-3]